MNDLKKIVQEFIEQHWDGSSKLLLALSGGPDSMALFHLLRECRVPFAVAHVNHRWRIESDEEAKQLAKLVASLGVVYYQKDLKPSKSHSNLEDRARQERLLFFQNLCKEHQFQAIVMAHHGDDHQETVLKRLFEGASLIHLAGLKPVSVISGFTPIWRPLLSVSKAELLGWLHQHQYTYFVDETNQDNHFLRARMRGELLPLLSKVFGKNIGPSLQRLSHASQDLCEFSEKWLTLQKNRFKESDEEVELDLKDVSTLSAFETKLILRDFFKRFDKAASEHQIDAIYLHLMRKSSNKYIKVGQRQLKLHRGILFLPKIESISSKSSTT